MVGLPKEDAEHVEKTQEVSVLFQRYDMQGKIAELADLTSRGL
jgi:hypothetical protein